MGLFGKKKEKNSFVADVIRCDEESYLIWKWKPEKSPAGSNRENEIRYGSSLRVKDGEVAVFVYAQKNGSEQDFIVGPYDETLKTRNFPVLSSIVGSAFGGSSPFQAEVYFINLAGIVQIKFGVPYFPVFDPRPQFVEIPVPCAVRGTISFRIEDYKSFIKLHRMTEFDLESFKTQIRDAVVKYVKGCVSNIPSDCQIPVMQMERKILEISDYVEGRLKTRLSQDFGVVVTGVDIAAVELDKSSEEYLQLKSVTADIAEQTRKAQAAVAIKNIGDMQRIQAENTQESLRIQREETQRARRLATEGSNLAAHMVDRQAEVGVEGARALGEMGANGAGGIDLGNGGVGFNPAALMAGMTLGGAVGANIAGVMNNAMAGGFNNPSAPMAAPNIPPVPPVVKFNVAVNGQSTGPFDISALRQMVANGTLTKDSYVWREGLPNWITASSAQELRSLFGGEVPPVPGGPPPVPGM